MLPISCDNLCAIVDTLETGVVVLDDQGVVLHWNLWISQRSGISPKEARGRRFVELFPDIAKSRLLSAIDHAVSHRLPSVLSPALHGTLLPLYRNEMERTGRRRMHQMTYVLPLGGAQGPAACLIQINDVTASISRERLLRQQAETLRQKTSQDPLTGLANRKRFEEALASEFAKAQQNQTALAVMMVDIDHFGEYNAHYGRELGDTCLLEISRLLAGHVRPIGDLLARHGGEEFALLLPGVTANDACQLAENIRLKIASAKIEHLGSNVARHVTVSIGMAILIPDKESDTNTLMSSVDVALYQAKHEGRNCAVFFSINDGEFRTCG